MVSYCEDKENNDKRSNKILPDLFTNYHVLEEKYSYTLNTFAKSIVFYHGARGDKQTRILRTAYDYPPIMNYIQIKPFLELIPQDSSIYCYWINSLKQKIQEETQNNGLAAMYYHHYEQIYE